MNGEFDFIGEIRRRARRSPAPADLILGIGDDAAILRQQSGRETLITVDLLVEDVDFRLDYAVPRWLGHKALAVSLSDIAAMGGVPRFSLLTLGIPPSLSGDEATAFREEFLAGYLEIAGEHGVTLIGGDMSSMPERLIADSIVIGECRAGGAVTRSGARAGDVLWVTGEIGASAAGLRLLLDGQRVKRGKEADDDGLQAALRAHLRPTPRVALGRALGESGIATSMIDISDGLTQDLSHLCEESRVAAIVEREALPVSRCLALVGADDEERLRLAIGGGEDFELLFTASPDATADIQSISDSLNVPITRIGKIVERNGSTPALLLRDGGRLLPLTPRGYDHFAKPSSPPA